jgi:SAM-dependent methyltransferase
MNDAMSAEFDTVAEWTARVAMDLGTAYRIPAACRGSGSPAALDWLLDALDPAPDATLLDCGAGVGGPAAYAAEHRSVRPVLAEPEHGACRAAQTMFDHPVVRASGSELPFTDESFDFAWSLGVLCTVPDQLGVLRELRRVVRPSGRIGLLVFMARTSEPLDQPEGNDFPTEQGLLELVEAAGLGIEAWRGTEEMAPIDDEWQSRVDEVDEALSDRYGDRRAWQLAERQSASIGRLLSEAKVTGELLVLRRR